MGVPAADAGAVIVQSVQVNDGNARRSELTRINVTFDCAAAPDAGAFLIVRRNGAGAGAHPRAP